VHRATNEKEGLEAAFLRVGDGEIELMAALRDDSPVGKFMARRGPGLHHVAYGVTDIDRSLAEAREAGLELIDSVPRIGMHGTRIAFVHPKSLEGVLTEFVET
jgi:methylmalonyl-CoA epimerase